MFWKSSGRRDAGPADTHREEKDDARGTTAPASGEGTLLTPVLRPSLGPETSVSGRLSFTVPTRIDGKLRGEVRATDLLMVGEEGFIEGTVRAQALIVLGEVHGDVRGADRVEVVAGGRLLGTVETRSLVVREGGFLDGDCRIGPPREKVRLLRSAPAS